MLRTAYRSPRHPKAMLSLDQLDLNGETWDEVITHFAPTPQEFGAEPWWAIALQGSLAWEQLKREFGITGEPYWASIKWSQIRSDGRTKKWQCHINWRTCPHHRWDKCHWPHTAYVPQHLWGLAKLAAVWLVARDRLP